MIELVIENQGGWIRGTDPETADLSNILSSSCEPERLPDRVVTEAGRVLKDRATKGQHLRIFWPSFRVEGEPDEMDTNKIEHLRKALPHPLGTN